MSAKRYVRSSLHPHGEETCVGIISTDKEARRSTVLKKRKVEYISNMPKEVLFGKDVQLWNGKFDSAAEVAVHGKQKKVQPHVVTSSNDDPKQLNEMPRNCGHLKNVTTSKNRSSEPAAVVSGQGQVEMITVSNSQVGTDCRKGFNNDKEENNAESHISNRTKWEPLEDQLYLLRDNVKGYVRKGTYNIAFSRIDPIIKETRGYVCNGMMSPRLGATRVISHIQNLLFVHQMESENEKQTEDFNGELLGYIERTVARMKEVLYTCDYYKDDCKQKYLEGDLVDLLDDVPDYFYEVPNEDVLYMPHLLANCNDYLSTAELIGHAESMDGSIVSDVTCCSLCEAEAGSFCSTTSECNEKDEREKNWMEERTFGKLVKTYTLGIMLQPNDIRRKTFQRITTKRQEIERGECNARNAWDDIERLVGKLRTEEEYMDIFAEFLTESNFNG